jgi:cobalt-zinc-cadmium efflux system protein
VKWPALIFLLSIATARAGLGLDRDFLTANEVEQIREAQDPNDRIMLYLHFAKQRMDLIQQYLAKDKPGRSIFIHNAIEDYSKIIEAIDSVSDDALRHNRPIDKVSPAVVSAEKEFVAALQKIEDSQPRDLDRYKFVLEDAINTTTGSRDLALEDAKKRTGELQSEDEKEKQERDALMPSKEVAERKKDADQQDQPKKKIPSLYRPGEKPQTPQQELVKFLSFSDYKHELSYPGCIGPKRLPHHHHHAPHGTGWILRVSLVATLAFTAFEVFAGFRSHSLALLSDAGHNFTDALALLLAAVGLYLQGKPADQSKTYGYQRAGVIAAFLNAATLIVISLVIFWEAVTRFIKPEPVNDRMMLWVAAAALILNGAIMLGLNRGKKGDINIRAAFVHMLGDALGAVAIIAGAIAIRYTGLTYIDPALSIALGLLIIYTAWDIAQESVNILLEGLPRGLELNSVTQRMRDVEGVLDVHDLHIWSLGSSTHALSCHVLIEDMPPSESEGILKRINAILCEFGIFHTTVQFEHAPCVLSDNGCRMTADDGHAHSHSH